MNRRAVLPLVFTCVLQGKCGAPGWLRFAGQTIKNGGPDVNELKDPLETVFV